MGGCLCVWPVWLESSNEQWRGAVGSERTGVRSGGRLLRVVVGSWAFTLGEIGAIAGF